MSETAIRAYAATKRFGATTIERWLRRPAADQVVLLELAERLRLGENHVRDLLDALEAIALRRGCMFGDILSCEPVQGVLQAGQARNETLHALKHALRRLRFPQLVAAETRLRDLVKKLALPAGVTITLPDNLEGEEIVLSVSARSAPELRRRIAGAAGAVDGAGLDEIYRVLGGEW